MTLKATTGSPSVENQEDEAAALAAADASTDANPAASSDADDQGAKEPASLLDVVKSAIEPKDDTAAASPAADGNGEAGAEGAEGKPAEVQPEAKTDDADLPFHNHPRFKELVAERNEFRTDSERYRNITGFMEANSLTADEVAEGFGIMAKLKSGTPEGLTEAREYFASNLALLDQHLGKVLPDDLRQRVDAGELDEAAAQELAEARATAALRKQHTESREAADSQAEEGRERIAAAQAMATAVDDWEQRTKKADPDYQKKAALVETTCRAIVQQTGQPPKTPEEAVALAEKALGQVNEQFKALLPKPKPVVPAPRGSSTPTATDPKTLKDAIRGAISR